MLQKDVQATYEINDTFDESANRFVAMSLSVAIAGLVLLAIAMNFFLV